MNELNRQEMNYMCRKSVMQTRAWKIASTYGQINTSYQIFYGYICIYMCMYVYLYQSYDQVNVSTSTNRRLNLLGYRQCCTSTNRR